MNFEFALQRLSDEGVDFVVIGGWAAIFHGSAHVTSELDICYFRDKENLWKLAGALAPLGCGYTGQWHRFHTKYGSRHPGLVGSSLGYRKLFRSASRLRGGRRV